MSLLRSVARSRGAGSPGVEARSTNLPITSFQEWIDIAYGRNGVSLDSAGNPDIALRHPTVFRSVNKIAGIVAQSPLGVRQDARLVQSPPIIANPSPGTLRPSAWKRTAAVSMLCHGAACGLVSADARRIDLIDPDRVRYTDRGGWTVDGRPEELTPVGRLWYVPYMTLPGSPEGLNPIAYARRTTFAGLAASEFGGNFFRDGAHPTHVIQPESDPGPDGARALKQRVMESVSGTSREPLVIPQSVKWHQIQINPEDSQFIEMMGFTGGQVAGFFGLMPEHVGLSVDGGTGLQYSNRENRQQDLLQDAVMPVLIPLEEAMTELLPGRLTVKFNIDGVLRSDLLARYQSYEVSARVEQMTGRPIVTNEEIRALENREPLPDDYRPANAAMEADA